MQEYQKLQPPSQSEDMDLLSLLKRLEIFDAGQDEDRAYSLTTDRGTEFVRGVLTQSLSNCYENIRRVETSKDGLLQKINITQKLLCKETGGVILSEEDVAIPFFSEKGHKTNLFGYWSSRGALYYVFSDTFMSIDECIQALNTEYSLLKHNLHILSGGSFTTKQKIAYADYLKNFFLTVYHAQAYPERFGITPTKDTARLKKVLRRASEEFTRVYYRLLLGYNVDYTDIRNEFEFVELNWDTIVRQLASSDLFECNWLKYPELDNPTIILRAAFSFLQEDGDIDVVIGVESGGTELCYVTKLLYQTTKKTRFIDTILVPLSRYTLQKSSLYSGQIAIAALEESLKNSSLRGKRILVVDDNSNTGGSAQLIFDVLQACSPKDVRIRVAEFDMHRSMFKHLNWDKRPDYIAHPKIFTCSVGITPITQGLDEYLPFRQQRKIIRLRILQEYFQSQLLSAKPVKLRPHRKVLADCKICAVHNTPDFTTCWNEGFEWFGIHCLYSSEKYDKKVMNLPRAHLLEYKMNLDFKAGENTGLPLAEVSSIRTMLMRVRDAAINPRMVFLIDGRNDLTIPALFKHVIPNDFSLPIYFQLQNKYSREIVNKVREQIKGLYAHDIGIIQTFGSNESESILRAIDKDGSVDFVLLDYRQQGGSGKTIEISRLRSLIQLITKQFFIAGGISSDAVSEYVADIGDIAPDFMVDLESSVEHKKSTTKSYVDQVKNPIIVRKSPTKTHSFARTWREVLGMLTHIREYEALDLEGSYFKEELNRAWLESRDKYGFYAVTPTMESYLSRIYSEKAEPQSVEVATRGLLEYAFLPSYYQHRPFEADYSRNQKTSWVIKRVPEFLEAISVHIREANLQFFVWTAGEDASNTTSEYKYVNEQKLKFEKSGLEAHFKAKGLGQFTFLASPTKLHLFESKVASFDKDTDIVVIDDRIDNLNTATEVLKQSGYSRYKTILISNKDRTTRHIVCSNVLHSLQHIEQPSKTVVFCDMDGVLIHEEFRNEHQPKNLYFTLNQYKKLGTELGIYGQRQSPLKINYNNFDQVHYPIKQIITLGISRPLDISSAQLMSVCGPVDVIPRVVTDKGREMRQEGNKYVNVHSFCSLISKERFVEYSFTETGFRGTLFSDINKSLSSRLSSILIVDIDTALLMTKVFSAQGIANRSILVMPENKAEKVAVKHKKDMFDYVISKDYQRISKIINSILEGEES